MAGKKPFCYNEARCPYAVLCATTDIVNGKIKSPENKRKSEWLDRVVGAVMTALRHARGRGIMWIYGSNKPREEGKSTFLIALRDYRYVRVTIEATDDGELEEMIPEFRS